MTPQDALVKALATTGFEPTGLLTVAAGPILAALAADGWTVALTQDARDGEALRLLREALPEGHEPITEWHYPRSESATTHQVSARGRVGSGPTIAAAADACREAIEATR